MKKLTAAILIFAFILTQSNFALALDKTPARNLRQPTTEADGTAAAVGSELGVPEEVVAEANAAGGRVSPLTKAILTLTTAASALLPTAGQAPAAADTSMPPAVVAVERGRPAPSIGPTGLLEVNNREIFEIAGSRDGKRIVVAGSAAEPTVWDVTNPKKPEKIGALVGHDDDVLCAAFNPSDDTIATGSRDGNVIVWKYDRNARGYYSSVILEGYDKDNVPIGADGQALPGDVVSLTFTPDGRFIITGSYNTNVVIWNPLTFKRIATLTAHKDKVYAVLVSPDGNTIYTAGHDKTLIAWKVKDWNTGKFEEVGRYVHGRKITSAAISPNGEMLAVGGTANVTVLDAKTLDVRVELMGHEKLVLSVKFCPANPNRLLSTTIGGSEGKNAILWSIEDKRGKPLAILTAPYTKDIYAGNFSSDGNQIYVSGYEKVLIYQLPPALAEANAVGKLGKTLIATGAAAAILTAFPKEVDKGPGRPAQPGMEVTISQKSTPSSTEPIVSNQDDWVPVYQPIELKVEGHSAQQDIYKPIMSPFASRPERPADLDAVLLTGEFKPGVSEDRPATFWMFFTPPKGTNKHSMVRIEILDGPATSPINVYSFIVNDKSIVTKGLTGYTLFRLADLPKDEKLGLVSVPVSLRPYRNEDEKGRKFVLSIRATAITPIEGIPANIPPENVPLAGEQANAMAAGSEAAAAGTILVVDDEPLVRSAMEDILMYLGHNVITAESGEKALEILNSGEHIDLIVSDNDMTGMTGLRLAEKRLESEATKGIPFVLFTALPPTALPSSDEELNTLKIAGILQKPAPLVAIRNAVAAALQPGVEPTEAAAAGTILVVDDEEAITMVVRAVLEREGYTVITAESGEKALEILNSGQRVDLIFSDNDMPRMTGLRLAEKRLKNKATEDIPFVLFTALPPENPQDLREDLGIEYILTKPANIEKIRETVAGALQSAGKPTEAAAAGIVSRLRIYMAAFAYRRAENILTKTATMASAGAARLFFDHVLNELVEVMIRCGIGSENEAVAVFKRYLPHSKTLHLFREAFRERLIEKGIAGRIAPLSSAGKQQRIPPDTEANAAGEPVEAAAIGKRTPLHEIRQILKIISGIQKGTLDNVGEILQLRNAALRVEKKIYIDANGYVRFAVTVKDPLAPHTGYEEGHYLALNPTPYFLLKTLEINNVEIALMSAATSPRHTRDLTHIFRNLASIVEKKESIEFDDGLTITFTEASTSGHPDVLTIMSRQEALAARVAEMEAAAVGQAEGATIAGVIASALHAKAKAALLKAAIEAAEPADTTVCLVFTPENYLLRAFADLIRLSNLNNRPVVVLNEKQMAELKQPENIPSLLNGIAAENGASEVKICTSEDEIYNMLSGKPVNIGDSLRLLDVVKIDPYEIFNEIDKYLGQLGIAVGDVEAAKEAYRALAGSV